jgi:hypothetical protein
MRQPKVFSPVWVAEQLLQRRHLLLFAGGDQQHNKQWEEEGLAKSFHVVVCSFCFAQLVDSTQAYSLLTSLKDNHN